MNPPTRSIDAGPAPSGSLTVVRIATPLFCVGCAFMAWAGHLPWMWLAAGVCALLAISSITTSRVVVDRAAGTITRESFLFGRWRIPCGTRAIADFTAITFRHVHDAEHPEHVTILVGLLRPDGSRWYVGNFNTGELHPGHAADYLALELAEATGLPIQGRGSDPDARVPPRRGGPWYYPLTKPRDYRFPRRDL